MKMTTDILPRISTPDTIDLRRGDTRFFRRYGPLEALYQKTWRPAEIRRVKLSRHCGAA